SAHNPFLNQYVPNFWQSSTRPQNVLQKKSALRFAFRFRFVYLLSQTDGRICHIILLSSLARSEEHTSELQSRENLVCGHLLEKDNSQRATCSACDGLSDPHPC